MIAKIGASLLALTLSSSAFAATKIVSFNGPAGEAYIGKFISGIKDTASLLSLLVNSD